MDKVLRNTWQADGGGALWRASILNEEEAPEGLNAERLRFDAQGEWSVAPEEAQLLSVLAGAARLELGPQVLALGVGTHLYLPPTAKARLSAAAGTELTRVWTRRPAQIRGARLLLRDEQFLSACAIPGQSLRWTLTPQYLSRRVFLHHDPALLSKGGHPVSWFHTTMFDVAGLPPNADGDPVFKMAYNSKTEFNVCYRVEGQARVRMALHPYREQGQLWGPWQSLDGDATYRLNEAAGGPEEEWQLDPSGQRRPRRNMHEVSAVGGYVSLICVFDPAPTGVERHRPGEYSDYQPIEQVLGTPEYEAHQAQLSRFDQMVDRLSLAKAEGRLEKETGGPDWSLYQSGRAAQLAFEASLLAGLDEERRAALEPWLCAPPR